MRTLILASAALGVIGFVAASQPADARDARSSAKRGAATQTTVPRTKALRRAPRIAQARSSTVELQDRSRFYHQVGRFNGQELFDAISDQAGDAGQ